MFSFAFIRQLRRELMRTSCIMKTMANEFTSDIPLYYHNAEIKRACRRDICYQPAYLSIITTHMHLRMQRICIYGANNVLT